MARRAGITRIVFHDDAIREVLKSDEIARATKKVADQIRQDVGGAIPDTEVTSRTQRTRKVQIVGSQNDDANFIEARTGALAAAASRRRSV